MNETPDIKQIAAILLRKWRVISLCAVLAAVTGVFLAAYVVSPRYISSVSLYTSNNTESAASGVVGISDINASQKLVNTYIVILQDDEVMEQVAIRLLEECEPEILVRSLPLESRGGELFLTCDILRGVIKMSPINNTEVLRIEAETGDAWLSAQICNIITEIAPDVIQRVVKAGSVATIGVAKPAGSPSFPSVPIFGAAGMLIGLAISAATALLAFLLDNTVKSEQDVRAHFNIPVLGEIPDHDSDFKRSCEEYA